ncbi:E3 ubiquitin-protein ligase RNF180-like [Haliotis asinina]|uniref:E3 ubiquitin-protein ligase RNF180-like n=1 Tax=Haliotis asinina TaxID=109174 RepID=UPI00353242D3
MDRFKLRCRRCRCVVLVSDDVINTHGQPVTEASCSSTSTSSVWFVSMENEELSWIQEAISQAMWIKGKLNCPKCTSRLGSFDFVKSAHCPCGQQTLPGVYILRDRVDKMLLKQASQQQDFNTRFARSENPLFKEDATSDSPLIKEASVNQQLTSSQECTKGNRVSGETQRHSEERLNGSDDPQGQDGCFGTARVVLREPRTDLQLCVSVAGVDQCIAPSAVEMDRLFNNDLRVNSEQVCQACVETQHRWSRIKPDGASENEVNVTKTLVRHVCNDGNQVCNRRDSGDRCPGISQRALCQGKNDVRCYVQPRRLKKDLKSRRRRNLRTKQHGEHFDDEETLDTETLNRFKHLEHEQSSSDDSIIEETILEEHECPVCLDLFLHPHVCDPCGHVFCETCLRHLAQESDNSTAFPCPMCRILIKSCRLDRDLTATIKLRYPVSYKHRRMSDSKYLSHRYPLPRSTGSSYRHTINEQIVYAVGGNENIYTLMSRLWMKCFTFLGAVILVLLVLCVSLAL